MGYRFILDGDERLTIKQTAKYEDFRKRGEVYNYSFHLQLSINQLQRDSLILSSQGQTPVPDYIKCCIEGWVSASLTVHCRILTRNRTCQSVPGDCLHSSLEEQSKLEPNKRVHVTRSGRAAGFQTTSAPLSSSNTVQSVAAFKEPYAP